ncbi:hypothetical protein [Brenneria rubrifaciens]|uniref:Uncharacterized protein n=1 Tax=Brenneria rubrifaciens TaxID=55213 RepID=A0A4P8R0E5_9GAMM|nr:hypothetical protein [Brenneria rubrifaciens]QCR10045.1 hypothetical protein EH207_16990 [Brenneria rubrifaciens]
MGSENKAQPKIFRAGLSDDELIGFLRDVIKKIEIRKISEGRPEKLRAQAVEAEKDLVKLDKDINSAIFR